MKEVSSCFRPCSSGFNLSHKNAFLDMAVIPGPVLPFKMEFLGNYNNGLVFYSLSQKVPAFS